ncbi:MAG TPA: HAMP domain-containing sensor histidine kinase [Acidimicrobiia bacterium]|nr:HAMP domain-containing sensor histidine kinase [Acidimicrobiia bacterium]
MSPTPRRWVPVLSAGLGGLALCVMTALATSMSAADAFELIGIAAGIALIGIPVGLLVLRALRTRPLGVQCAALALTTTGSLMLGALAAAQAMFISEHDLAALSVVLVASGTAGVITSLLLGARIGAASSDLVETARRIGGENPVGPVRVVDAPRELARLGEELAEMEIRLEAARRAERTLEASRRELVAWVSHDLRTPLSGIRAIVEALEDGVVDDPATVARYHRTLREEADHLAALVDDLFELSRTQAGALHLRFARVSLSDLVSDALASSAPVAAAKGVKLEGRVVGPPPELDASAPEVLRVLRNLLENAIRHTPSDGSILVEAGIDDDAPESVYVSVHDSGGGVPEDDLDRIFDVAFQVDHARTPGSGAGLGLAIAKGFADAHQGEITVCNESGGARFTLRLPCERAE